MSSFKEYKDSQFDEKVKLTVLEFRQNTCNLMTYQLCDYFVKREMPVDDEMKDTISRIFEYAMIKKRSRLISNMDNIKDGNTTVEKEIEKFAGYSWYQLSKGKNFINRKEYLNWVHHKFSCGITRKQLVEYMWKLIFTNNKVSKCIYNLNDVRKYLN